MTTRCLLGKNFEIDTSEEEKKSLKDSEDSKRMDVEKSDNFSRAFEVLKIGDF